MKIQSSPFRFFRKKRRPDVTESDMPVKLDSIVPELKLRALPYAFSEVFLNEVLSVTQPPVTLPADGPFDEHSASLILLYYKGKQDEELARLDEQREHHVSVYHHIGREIAARTAQLNHAQAAAEEELTWVEGEISKLEERLKTEEEHVDERLRRMWARESEDLRSGNDRKEDR